MKANLSIITQRMIALATLLLGGIGMRGQAPAPESTPLRLELSSPARLVDCAPVTQIPCITAGFTPVDAAGKPAAVAMPPASQLADAFTIHGGDGASTKPFYAMSGTGPDAGLHTNLVLMLVDISGSMNQPAPGGMSRFAAVKSALAKYLDAMQEDSDRIAIVPFESHNVVSTIRSAVFVTHKNDALAQLNALPAPGTHNNTALYQAVFSGVDALRSEMAEVQREGHVQSELQPHLIVMTDGKNEVAKGDDSLLLDGPLGLQQAAAQVQASHFDTIGIGFGNRDAIDAASLQRLSTRFFYAADAAQLLDALHLSRPLTSHQIQIAWLGSEANRVTLAGRDQSWTPSLQLPRSAEISGSAQRMIFPAFTAPVYDRHATANELQALIAAHPPANSGWSTVVVHLLIFLAASLLLLMFWFWLPRLVWADRFLGETPSPRRWSAERGTTAASGVQVRSTGPRPEGFDPEAEAVGPIRRSAAQTTQVQPRGEFSRTRLTFDTK